MSLNHGFAIECDQCGLRLSGLRADNDWQTQLSSVGWLLNSGNPGVRPMSRNGIDVSIDLCPDCAKK